jgi:hypothetical protein
MHGNNVHFTKGAPLAIMLSMLMNACYPSRASLSSDATGGETFNDSTNNFTPQPMNAKTAFEYFSDENILAGWNLGNALDSYRNGIGNELAWGEPFGNPDAHGRGQGAGV